MMSTVEEIESAIAQLPPQQLTELSQWFDEYLEQAWDVRMEADAKAGKFSHFKEEIAQAEAAGDLIDFP
jgi:hypothetical protein